MKSHIMGIGLRFICLLDVRIYVGVYDIYMVIFSCQN